VIRTPRLLHLDVDAFLASVEQALHPELVGRPVVVGGSPASRNLVMSCSYEARARGIRPGMALREAHRRCPRAVFRDGDSQAANRLRDETTRVLLGFTPRVEVASIDDFYLDLTGTERLNGRAFEAAGAIRRAVLERTRLSLTIGIGTSRTVARLAGKLAKPGGVAEILPGGEVAFLGALPVEHLPGVGHVIGQRLERFSIRTVRELRLVPREVLFATFGSAGLALHERARGHDPAPVETTHELDEDGRLRARPPRTLRRETTFEPEEGRPAVIEAMLSYLVERAAHRLRSQGLAAGALVVRVRWVDSNPRPGSATEGLSAERRVRLSAPSDSTDELLRVARERYAALPRRRALLKRIGIELQGLVPVAGWQGRLFSDGTTDEALHASSHADRQRRLDRALDRVREKLGFGRVLRGTSTPLAATHPLRPSGYRLRTPSLNQ
jgi:DNA polymerase-4